MKLLVRQGERPSLPGSPPLFQTIYVMLAVLHRTISLISLHRHFLFPASLHTRTRTIKETSAHAVMSTPHIVMKWQKPFLVQESLPTCIVMKREATSGTRIPAISGTNTLPIFSPCNPGEPRYKNASP